MDDLETLRQGMRHPERVNIYHSTNFPGNHHGRTGFHSPTSLKEILNFSRQPYSPNA